jgi:molecular chaperone GrpE (heat shock protein)
MVEQEKPKQIKCYCGHTDYCDCGPLEESKQETLEQASWRFNPLKKLDGEFLRAAFMKGAKWQSERMYSEEDLKEAFAYYSKRVICDIKYLDDDFEEFIEQLKKQKDGKSKIK